MVRKFWMTCMNSMLSTCSQLRFVSIFMSTYFILNVCMVNGFSNMSNLDLFSSVEPE
jgi:hypothetical protein